MKERPILFSAPMVRALLDGTKTQTRRVCKSQPYVNGFHFDGHDILCHNDYLPPSAMLMDVKRGPHRYTTSDAEGWEVECPHGQPGDQLWVREAWARTQVAGQELTVYRESDNRTDYGGPWKPGIHLFRLDSRIDLLVVDVRVERLQDISETDARAEGVRELPDQQGAPGAWWTADVQAGARLHGRTARDAFRLLWESINGAGTWDANPWAWVVEFRRIRP